jgi:hypothetical protein
MSSVAVASASFGRAGLVQSYVQPVASVLHRALSFSLGSAKDLKPELSHVLLAALVIACLAGALAAQGTRAALEAQAPKQPAAPAAPAKGAARAPLGAAEPVHPGGKA